MICGRNIGAFYVRQPSCFVGRTALTHAVLTKSWLAERFPCVRIRTRALFATVWCARRLSDRSCQDPGRPYWRAAQYRLDRVARRCSQRPQPADAGWSTITAAVAEHASGLVFVLEQGSPSPPTSPAAGADVIGVLADADGRRPPRLNVAHALSAAQHPAGRLSGRRLTTD